MKRITVTAGILAARGRVLLTRRSPEEDHGGMWEFPGGKVEEGEGLRSCLARELKEELGIDAAIGAFLADSRHTYGKGHVHLLAFFVSRFAGDLNPKNHDRLEWVDPTSLIDYDLLPADIPIARRLAGLLLPP